MISKKMAATLNEHLNYEFFSSYVYVSMASHAQHIGLKGFAHWFRIQVQEELIHVQKFYNYILDQGEKVILEAIEKPQNEFESPLALYEITLGHERQVTARINKVASFAKEENDHATSAMLQWFITEQVEEEAAVSDIIQQLKLVGNSGSGLFMIDKELAARVLTVPNPPN
jgi:ferritin